MPVNPADPDALARAVADDVTTATDRMLLDWTDWLTGGPTGLPNPEWEANRRAALDQLRGRLITDARTPRQVIAGSVRDGLNATAALASGTRRLLPSVERAATETIARLNNLWPTAIQGLTNEGSRALTTVMAQVRDGNLSRVAATSRVVDDLARAGVHGFTDAAGRRWTASAFAEMSVRTGVTDAHTAGAIEGASRRGTDLVMVSDAPRECPLCQPFEGKLLSLSGTALGTEPEDGDGAPAAVVGTLDSARAAGFQHPNCRHRLYPFIPGQTRLRPAEDDRANYVASQRQRALERRLRKAQTRAQALTRADPRSAVAAAARAQANTVRAQIVQLLDDFPTLQRRTDREHATVGDAARRARPIRQRDTTLAARLHLEPPPPDLIRLPAPKPKPRTPKTDEAGYPNTLTYEYLARLSEDDLDRLAEHLALRLDSGNPVDAQRFDDLDDFLTFRTGYDEAVAGTAGRADSEAEEAVDAWVRANGRPGLTHPRVAGRQNAAPTREAVIREWQLYVEQAYLDAEEATRGSLLSRRGIANKVNPRDLITADPRIVQANASEELLNYWEANRRLSFDEFYYGRTGNPRWADRAAAAAERNSRIRRDAPTASGRQRRR